MSKLIVAISDMKTSGNPKDVIITYSLGSCLGVTVYDPVRKVGGLVHCLLPLARLNPVKARANPCHFVNTGVSMLIKTLFRMGARKADLIIKAAGGAHMMGLENRYNTGGQNYAALKNLLVRNELELAGEEVGGTIPRTMFLEMDTGKAYVSTFRLKKEI